MLNLLTIKEAARKLRISERTMRTWIEKKYISFFKLPSGTLRISEENLEGWVKKREVKAA